MHNKFISFIIISSIIVLGGCGRTINKNMSPPSDTKWAYIEIKNPSPFTGPFPLGVRYISYKCMKKRISGFDGSIITEPSYNLVQIPLQRQDGDLWKGQVAMTGGGLCQWTLSAISLGIRYHDAAHLGKELTPGAAVGAKIAFDNDASRNGQFYDAYGKNLQYSPKYYPVIERWSATKDSIEADRLNLFGKNTPFWLVRVNIVNDDFHMSYQPTIDEEKKVEMIFPYEKKEGATYTFVYPDGERVSSREIDPDFHRVDKIK